jgi:2-polyprenyl-6-methoxyphenol hydroxylase-like FAD-dependent oxidoreductase
MAATCSSVLIVGGGIAGMTLAVELNRSGILSQVVEINPRWTVPGVGLALQGSALRAVKAVAVLDRCIERGFGYSSLKVCDSEGNVTETVAFPRLCGPDYPGGLGIMRQTLHAILQETLAEAGVPVRCGVTVSSLTQQRDNVNVEFTDRTQGSYELVVGADGAQSQIRDIVFGPQFKPTYAGQAVWRATVRRPAAVVSRYNFYGRRHKAGFNPVSTNQMYVYLAQNLPEFVRLPNEQLPEVMRGLLGDFHGLVGVAREEITDPEQIVYRPVSWLLLPPPWYRGRVVLIGDAAHATTPNMAAGAGIAIEDSVVLASLLRSESSLPRALENFMARRYGRCRMVVENSRQLGEWEMNPNAPGVDPTRIWATSLEALAQPI